MRYDPFQQQAIDYINQGLSVIVAAPTGAGKTAIAEHVIESCLRENKKIVYTAPIKALSNQKYRDFNKNYHEKTGILTGDITINANASTLIMTTEIFRNKILEEHSSLADYAWVIFDEMHYLDDFERGSVWEESLMCLPKHMNVLGLSATIPNVHEISEWLQNIHNRPFKVVIENNRPVPLHFYFQCQDHIHDDIHKLKNAGFHLRGGSSFRGRVSRNIGMKINSPTSLIRFLKDEDKLPCIYFCFNRRRTEELANNLIVFNFLTEQERIDVTTLFDRLCDKYDIVQEASTYDIKPLIERGIAYHHAGMLPTLKEVIEQLFTTKLIKVIFTTETFALGINMPARCVIFDELKKFYGHAVRPLKTRDFYQMAGRAGRRSMDKEGFVFLRVNPHDISFHELYHMMHGEPEKVYSRFNASYATILNLYGHYNEKLYEVYPLSFHYFQEGQRGRKKAMDLLYAKVKILKEYGCIRKNKITTKGEFAGKVYGYELLLSELFEKGILEKLSMTELGILAIGIVYEPRKGTPKPKLSRQAQNLQDMTNDILLPILKMENNFHIKPFSKAGFFHLAPALEGWLRGDSFEEILKLTEVDEGEVVRYFRMGVQVLREILDTPVSNELRGKIHQTIQKINRDVVDAEKQLRE